MDDYYLVLYLVIMGSVWTAVMLTIIGIRLYYYVEWVLRKEQGDKRTKEQGR